ncbi:MAG: hypothetical protein V3V84_07730 [Candidatus Bathyarchaeia archaeon]
MTGEKDGQQKQMLETALHCESDEYSFVTATTTQEFLPSQFRYAEYPNGDIKLQGGYVWVCGFNSGTTWKDIDTVKVNENGVE